MLFSSPSLMDAELLERSVARFHDPNLVPTTRSATLERKAKIITASQAKRLVDVVISSLMIVFLLPAFVLIAWLISLEGSGPILFRQERYGRNRQKFQLYKFRSMRVAESSGSFTQVSVGDARVTRVGRILRKTSLDELPQLFNVLKGDMTLVGPRPHAVAMDDAYRALIQGYEHRHLVKPGLTGWAQIAGHRGPTDALAKIQSRLKRDLAYIEQWSVMLDLKILLLTPLALASPNAI